MSRATHIVFYEDDDIDKSLFEVKLIKDRLQLVNKQTGHPYRGDSPYVILEVDGRDRSHELGAFSRTHASAALLERFYGIKNSAQLFNTLGDAMQLYNDYSFYTKAIKLKHEITSGLEIGTISKGDEQYQRLKQQFCAHANNIDDGNELFKIELDGDPC